MQIKHARELANPLSVLASKNFLKNYLATVNIQQSYKRKM